MINVSIIGANGYTGLELMQILSFHRYASLKHIVSRSNAGTKICSMYPNLTKLKDRLFEDLNIEEIVKDTDIVFTALPHAASAEICSVFYKAGIKVIDLSADFRYNSVSVYENTYKVTHPDKELLAKAVYGLPEIYKGKIKDAKIIGNPGCYTTCSILSIYPLLKERLIDINSIIIDAKSGVSGAGKKAETDLIFCEVNENFKAYGVTTHRHTSEIEQELSLAAKEDVKVSFTPHLLPVQRGIFATIYCNLKTANKDNIAAAYKKYYENEPFVIVNTEGDLPQLKNVRNSNFIQIGYKIDTRLNRIIITGVIDNLIKGASGQAVQNMNIMFGLEETEGLSFNSRYI